MKIEHLAIWVEDLEVMREFYLRYFDTSCGSRYENATKKFYSYFIIFNEAGSRIELMHRPDIADNDGRRGFSRGLAHVAITVGNENKVNAMIGQLRADGFEIIGEPRVTGDGYYEGVFLDPEGNVIELIA